MPVGASRPIEVDIRVVAATHRDLGAMVDRGEFRQDLYARLAGYTVQLPPLRQRREDMGLLVAALMSRHATSNGIALPAIDAAAARAVFLHSWPRNVRELDSCLMAAAILAGPEPIQLDHLAAEVRQGPTRPAAGAERPSGEGTFSDRISREAAADVRARIASNGGYDDDSTDPAVLPAGVPLSEEDRRIREEVVASLRTHGGNISAVARALGKDRKQIQRWVKRFDLDPQSFR